MNSRMKTQKNKQPWLKIINRIKKKKKERNPIIQRGKERAGGVVGMEKEQEKVEFLRVYMQKKNIQKIK